jgi:hypothetical protein
MMFEERFHVSRAWHVKAQELRATGMSYAAVARELGVTKTAVWQGCNPERAAAIKRRWRVRSGGACDREYRRRNWYRIKLRDQARAEGKERNIPTASVLAMWGAI